MTPESSRVEITRSLAAKSVLWSTVENGGLALISFGALIIFSRVLTPTDFGIFSAMLALVELLGVLVIMTFHDALVQRKEVTELHFDTAFTFTIVLSLVFAGGCAVFAPFFAHLFGKPEAWPLLVGLSLCFPASALSATIVAQQRRELQFRALAFRSLIGRFAGALVGITLVVLGAGVWGLVVQQVLIIFLGSVVLWVLADKHPRLRFGWPEFKQLARFGLPSVGGVFLTFSIKRLFIIFAGIFLGAEAAGYLNLSIRAVDVFWAIAATAVSQVALPILAGLQSYRARLQRAYQQATTFACLALYLCFGALALMAPEVVEVLFGARWVSIAPYVSVLAALIVVQAPRLMAAPVLTAMGHPRDLLLALVAELILVLTAVFASGMPSVWWAIGIWAARELLGAPITGWLLWRRTGLGVRSQLLGVAVPASALAAMAVAVFAVRPWLGSDLGVTWRLLILLPVCAVAFVSTIVLVDRSLVRAVIGLGTAALSRRVA